MATKCVVNKSTMTDIADAIRTKGGTSATLLPSEMPAAIANLPSGGGATTVQYDSTTGQLYVEQDYIEI